MPDAENAELAAQLEGLDPFALLAGTWEPAALFLAPLTPAMAAARTRFLADGSGPLAQVAESLASQGVPAAEAAAKAREMVTAAIGMAVLVVTGDRGVAAIPQFWFGHLDPRWIEGFIQGCGAAANDGAVVRQWFARINSAAHVDAGWPRLISGEDPREQWLDLAHAVADSDAQAVGALADLGHWCAAAVAQFPGRIDPDDAAALARCHLLAGEEEPGLRLLTILVDADAEIAVEVAQAAADAAIALGRPQATEGALSRLAVAVEQRVGRCYELRLLLVRLRAAGNDPRLIEAARDLISADRKNARQDLSREPIWRVVIADPGDLLDTAAAAALLDRSAQFVAKRLESGLIPHHRDGDRLRLPRTALLAWKAVMDEHQLLG